MPPPPPGSGGSFAFSENWSLERILQEKGFKILRNTDVTSVWDYPDTDTALKGLLSVGPAAKAIENAGFEKAYETTLKAVQPYVKHDGRIVHNNKYRVLIAEK